MDCNLTSANRASGYSTVITSDSPETVIDIPSCVALDKIITEKSTLYVTDETGKHQEKLLKILGTGGCKQAIEIARGRALILPNMTNSSEWISSNWERIVLEEVKMSKMLTRLELLSPLSEQVSVTVSESSQGVIPAYISETFEILSSKGCFIIDTKDSKSSTWKPGQHYLFQSDEERLSEKNWDSVFDSLLNDVAKICLFDIPAKGDSLNIAVVKKNVDSLVCQHEVRYFGFDFSSKFSGERGLNFLTNKERATGILNSIIDYIFFYEFGAKFDYNDESETSLVNLKDRLVQRYTIEVLKRRYYLEKAVRADQFS